MDSTVHFCDRSLESFDKITKKPTKFLEANEDFCNEIKEILKETYDFTKNEEIKTIKSSALPELIVKKFDLEQIWQQIELQNNSLLTRSLKTVSKLLVAKSNLLFKNLETNVQNEEIEEELDDGKEAPSDGNEASSDGNKSSDEDLDLSDLDSNEDKTEDEPKKIKPSIVDDEFFKLDEMEQFLNAEEKRIDDPDSGNDSENSDEESVDLFEADDDDDDTMKTARYKDFFVQQEETREKKRNKFLEEMEENDEDTAKSSFEQRQERLNRKIEEIEEDAIQEKPWQLKGEITADSRPQNSLLEEVVDFDLTTRPAPVITEQTTMQLEDIIKQRIKDKAFDSVERKAKPVDTPLEYKKKLVLDQEKSKESLAQIYEKEYLEQQAALDPDGAEKEEKEPELHKEISSMMKNLFSKLDALSNFHFTPKPAIPELKIVSNLPAITMEEVAPVAVSDATLLAPEEVKTKPKADVMGKNERTATDKKRERRKKKIKMKIHAKEKLSKMKPGLGNKYSKEKMKNMLEKVTRDKNVDKMDESVGKSIKSSKAFFTQLQDEVKSQIKRKSTEQQSKKNRNTLSAKKLKL